MRGFWGQKASEVEGLGDQREDLGANKGMLGSLRGFRGSRSGFGAERILGIKERIWASMRGFGVVEGIQVQRGDLESRRGDLG